MASRALMMRRPADAGYAPRPAQTPRWDREMRCTDCGARVFSSRAPKLVAEGFPCPACAGELELVAAAPH